MDKNPLITFYVLQDRDPIDKIRAACKLISEEFEQKIPVHIIVPNQELLNQVDETLWHYPLDRYIPHESTNIKPEFCLVSMSELQIYVGTGESLVNLSDSVPKCLKQFDHVHEIVIQNPQELLLSRERYKQYRALNYKIEYLPVEDWETQPLKETTAS